MYVCIHMYIKNVKSMNYEYANRKSRNGLLLHTHLIYVYTICMYVSICCYLNPQASGQLFIIRGLSFAKIMFKYLLYNKHVGTSEI